MNPLEVVAHHKQGSPVTVTQVCTNFHPWLSDDLMLPDCFLRWGTLMGETYVTLGDIFLELERHSGPIHKFSWPPDTALNANVCCVALSQHLGPQHCRDDHRWAFEDKLILHSLFIRQSK